mmetsp:Transcript_21966/g.41137  ORF Transcript_21966/g.41137 Transcript_21966/m.41137 type:complete len:102 (+) Transcript_21966:1391-1696(+)
MFWLCDAEDASRGDHKRRDEGGDAATGFKTETQVDFGVCAWIFCGAEDESRGNHRRRDEGRDAGTGFMTETEIGILLYKFDSYVDVDAASTATIGGLAWLA